MTDYEIKITERMEALGCKVIFKQPNILTTARTIPEFYSTGVVAEIATPVGEFVIMVRGCTIIRDKATGIAYGGNMGLSKLRAEARSDNEVFEMHQGSHAKYDLESEPLFHVEVQGKDGSKWQYDDHIMNIEDTMGLDELIEYILETNEILEEDGYEQVA